MPQFMQKQDYIITLTVYRGLNISLFTQLSVFSITLHYKFYVPLSTTCTILHVFLSQLWIITASQSKHTSETDKDILSICNIYLRIIMVKHMQKCMLRNVDKFVLIQ